MYSAFATSYPRSNIKMRTSEEQTQAMRHTTATFAETATVLFVVRTDDTADDASKATAMPEAVIMVLAPSTYIFLLSVLIHLQSRFHALSQTVQTKSHGALATPKTNMRNMHAQIEELLINRILALDRKARALQEGGWMFVTRLACTSDRAYLNRRVRASKPLRSPTILILHSSFHLRER